MTDLILTPDAINGHVRRFAHEHGVNATELQATVNVIRAEDRQEIERLNQLLSGRRSDQYTLPPMPKPHNPDGVTVEQLAGRRLLDEDEVSEEFTIGLGQIHCWQYNAWDEKLWAGNCPGYTYATFESKPALRALRGLPPISEQPKGGEPCATNVPAITQTGTTKAIAQSTESRQPVASSTPEKSDPSPGLKSCPFCGKQPLASNGRIECFNQSCGVILHTLDNDQWNTRAEDDRIAALEAELAGADRRAGEAKRKLEEARISWRNEVINFQQERDRLRAENETLHGKLTAAILASQEEKAQETDARIKADEESYLKERGFTDGWKSAIDWLEDECNALRSERDQLRAELSEADRRAGESELISATLRAELATVKQERDRGREALNTAVALKLKAQSELATSNQELLESQAANARFSSKKE